MSHIRKSWDFSISWMTTILQAHSSTFKLHVGLGRKKELYNYLMLNAKYVGIYASIGMAVNAPMSERLESRYTIGNTLFKIVVYTIHNITCTNQMRRLFTLQHENTKWFMSFIKWIINWTREAEGTVTCVVFTQLCMHTASECTYFNYIQLKRNMFFYDEASVVVNIS